jgi:PAS domain S-box-containing protein
MSRDVRVLVWLPDRPARPDIAAIPAANREWLLPRSMVSEPQRGASRKNVEGNSEHVSAIRALGESEERFRALVESANDAIFIWDRDLRCLEANRAACERLGYTRAELLTMTATQISAPEQAASAAARAEAIVEQGSALVESVHMARDGTRDPGRGQHDGHQPRRPARLPLDRPRRHEAQARRAAAALPRAGDPVSDQWLRPDRSPGKPDPGESGVSALVGLWSPG